MKQLCCRGNGGVIILLRSFTRGGHKRKLGTKKNKKQDKQRNVQIYGFLDLLFYCYQQVVVYLGLVALYVVVGGWFRLYLLDCFGFKIVSQACLCEIGSDSKVRLWLVMLEKIWFSSLCLRELWVVLFWWSGLVF